MKLRLRNILFSSVFLMLLSVEVSGQTHNLPEPQMQSSPGIPPPVGLPIDFGISALIAAGLGLGIYHIKNRK